MRIIRSVAVSLGLAVALTSATTATGETGRNDADAFLGAAARRCRRARLAGLRTQLRRAALQPARGDQQRKHRRGVSRWSLYLPPGNVATGPVAVDGVVFFASGYSVVHAVDAVTGRLLWTYDPKVPEAAGEAALGLGQPRHRLVERQGVHQPPTAA